MIYHYDQSEHPLPTLIPARATNRSNSQPPLASRPIHRHAASDKLDAILVDEGERQHDVTSCIIDVH
jgi:hypothetical protein